MRIFPLAAALGTVALFAACSRKDGPAQKVKLHDNLSQQTQNSPEPAPTQQTQIAGLPRLVPVVLKARARLSVGSVQRGAGVGTLQFDLLYTGFDPIVDCGYQEYDSTGAPIGPPGSLPLHSGERTSETLVITDTVDLIKLTLQE